MAEAVAKRPRIVDPDAGRDKLRREGRCRVCHREWPLQRHHLVPRSLLGDDLEANLVPLCVYCHDEWEHTPHRQRIGAAIRRTLMAEELAYVVDQMGEGGLDRYYPPRFAP